MDDEQYVREQWILVHCCDGSYRDYTRGTVLVQDVNGHWFDFKSWAAAGTFTRIRVREIKQIREEINLLRSMIALLASEKGDMTAPVYARTIIRLENELAKTSAGMKIEKEL